jgi:hypothetical protein
MKTKEKRARGRRAFFPDGWVSDSIFKNSNFVFIVLQKMRRSKTGPEIDNFQIAGKW